MTYKDSKIDYEACHKVLLVASKCFTGMTADKLKALPYTRDELSKAIADLCRKQWLRFDSLYHRANKGERTYLITERGRARLDYYNDKLWRKSIENKDATTRGEMSQ